MLIPENITVYTANTANNLLNEKGIKVEYVTTSSIQVLTHIVTIFTMPFIVILQLPIGICKMNIKMLTVF